MRLNAYCSAGLAHPLTVAGNGSIGVLGGFAVSIEPLEAPGMAPSPVQILKQNIAIKFSVSPLKLAALLPVLQGRTHCP